MDEQKERHELEDDETEQPVGDVDALSASPVPSLMNVVLIKINLGARRRRL